MVGQILRDDGAHNEEHSQENSWRNSVRLIAIKYRISRN